MADDITTLGSSVYGMLHCLHGAERPSPCWCVVKKLFPPAAEL